MRVRQRNINVFFNVYASSSDVAARQRAKHYVDEQMAMLLPEHQVFVRSIGAQIRVENATHVLHEDEGTEIGTLKLLWDHCQKKDLEDGETVVYLHNKGSFHPKKENDLLRKWLTRAALSRECSNMPSSCNVCSYRMSPLPHPHTPGNMWAAKCEYIKQLIDPTKFGAKMEQLYQTEENPMIGTGRYAAEHWVHSHLRVQPCDLSTSDYAWNYDGLPEVDNFGLEAAPRYDWNKLSKGLSRNDPRFGFDHRLAEYKFLYNETPPVSWFGWVFYHDAPAATEADAIKQYLVKGEEIFLNTSKSMSPVTDKVTTHTYQIMYGRFLLPYYAQNPTMKMLEIGLGCDMNYGPGASTALWKKLFPEADLWEAEFNADCVEKHRGDKLKGFNVLIGDQGNETVLDSWVQESGGNFDVIIDDGGHQNCQIWHSFLKLWPTVKPGGL